MFVRRLKPSSRLQVDPRPHAGRHPCAQTRHTDIRGVLCPDVVMFVLCLATRMRGPDQQEIGRED
jgi:hypothetical protein